MYEIHGTFQWSKHYVLYPNKSLCKNNVFGHKRQSQRIYLGERCMTEGQMRLKHMKSSPC